MSHQTGIKCGDKLKEVFCECTTQGTIRCVQVAIENESLVCMACVNKNLDSWKDEFDDVVLSLLKDRQPAYLLYQLDSKNSWLFITYSPDDAPVRQKMLYAATRATLKSEFGGGFITEEIFGNSKKDVSYSGYVEYMTHKNAPPPLTQAEEEIQYLEENEAKSAIGSSTRHQTVQGIAFPITSDAEQAIRDFRDGMTNHIELSVDTEKEEIYLQSTRTIGASDLEGLISSERAGYHLFNYAHRYNGEDISSIGQKHREALRRVHRLHETSKELFQVLIALKHYAIMDGREEVIIGDNIANYPIYLNQKTVFIYSMPGYSIPIKARMLYSSCKAPLIDTLEGSFGITIDRKIECDSSEKLTEEYLRNEVHPPAVDKKQTFEKPKAPGRRGPTRRPRRPADDVDE